MRSPCPPPRGPPSRGVVRQRCLLPSSLPSPRMHRLMFPALRPSVVIFMRGTVPAGVEPRNMEPDKCEGWEWCTWDEVARKQPLFRSLEMFIEDGMHLSI